MFYFILTLYIHQKIEFFCTIILLWRSIANILSLKFVDDIEGIYITMNTKDQPGERN